MTTKWRPQGRLFLYVLSMYSLPSMEQELSAQEKSGSIDAGSNLVSQIQNIERELAAIQKPLIDKLHNLLREHAGTVRPLEEMKEVASLIQQLLHQLGLRVRCPRCDQPAFLRAHEVGAKNYRKPVFDFDHGLIDGKMVRHAQQSSFPPNLEFALPPPDKRKRRK